MVKYKKHRIINLKDQMQHFLDSIKKENPSSYTKDREIEIYQEFKDLYTAFNDKSNEWIAENFSRKDIKKIDCLSLGLKNQNNFKELISIMEKDNKTTIKNVVGFVNSEKGRQAIIENNLSILTNEEMIEFFGGMFGVNIADSCLRSLKAEKLGSILGYALSGKFEQDYKIFRESHPNYEKEELSWYLESKISSSDFRLEYRIDETMTEYKIDGSIREDLNRQVENKTRGRNCIDHAFRNKNNILIGLSTANKNVNSQGTSHSTAFMCAKIIAENTLSSDAEVEGFLLLIGRFPASEDKNNKKRGQKEGGKIRKMIVEGNKENPEDAIKSVLQMSYLALYGNVNTPAQVELLAKFNPFIAGCDTLDLFDELEKINSISDSVNKNKTIRNMVIKRLTETLDVLNNSQLEDVFGTHGYINLYIEDVLNVYSKLPFNFPHEFSESEWEDVFRPLNDSLSIFYQKIGKISKQDALDFRQKIRRTKKLLENKEKYNEEVREGVSVIGEEKKIIWNGKGKGKEKKYNENYSKKDVIKMGRLLRDSLGGEWIKQKFDIYLNTLEKRFSGVPIEDLHSVIKGSYTEQYKSRESLRQTISNIKRQIKANSEIMNDSRYSLLSEFVEKTGFYLWEDKRRVMSVNKKKNDLFIFMNKCMKYLNDSHIKTQDVINDVTNRKPYTL